MRDDDLPDTRQESEPDELDNALRGEEDDIPASPSLTEEVLDLIEDGRTYAEAEFHYQKTRAAFAADRGKSVALYGLFALGFVHLALIALVVGAVIVLSPLITPLGATAVVTVALLIGAFILVRLAGARAREIGEAFDEDGE